MKKLLAVITTLICCVGNFNVNAESLNLPMGDTNVYTYMDYNCITDESSQQWALQTDENTYTSQYGLRIYTAADGKKYFLVALTSYYGSEIGSTYKVTLDNGSEFNVMLGDCKGEDTENTYGHKCYNFITQKDCINVIEFIVDVNELPDKVINWGSLSALDFFDGNISSIESLDNRWRT